jgi:hypothetical protein
MDKQSIFALALLDRLEDWVKHSDTYQLDFGDSLEQAGMIVNDDTVLNLLAYMRDRITDNG